MMKNITPRVIVLVLVICTAQLSTQTIQEYILKANTMQQAGNLKKAIAVMVEAIQKLPNEALAFSYCGFFHGLQAGNTKDDVEAANLVKKAFSYLDKAVSLNQQLPLPRYHRGILSIKVPEFLGKLDQGIEDLEILLQLAKNDKTAVRKDTLFNTVLVLTEGYERKESWDKAIDLLEQFLKVVPRGQWQTTTESLLKKIKTKKKTLKEQQDDN
jgi:tetratricopeptide (TPR) repeat protein